MAEAKASLIVADLRGLIREGLAALCERSGKFDIAAVCADGAEAFRQVCLLKPDLCVLSIDLPELHPFELMTRAREAGVRTRFGLLAPRQDRKTVLEALRAGSSGFLLEDGPVGDILEGLEQMARGGIYFSPAVDADRIFGAGAQSGDPLERLSTREYQVFSLLVQGVRAKEIANRLNLSPKTIDSHRKNLMQKLDIHDVAGLVRFSMSRQ
ncbi:MAG: response regulator transcription factor [Bryobacteraceae bacterium]